MSLVVSGDGSGVVTLSGMLPDTYSGATYVNGYVAPSSANAASLTSYANTLTLSKLANVTAVPGNLNIIGGTVTETAGEQIAATANVSITNLNAFGVLNVPNAAGVNQTINSLTVLATDQPNVLPATGGALDLAGTGTVLTMTAGQVTAPIYLGSSGTAVTIWGKAPATILAPTVNAVGGTYQAVIASPLNLNTSSTAGLQRTFNIDAGPAVNNMQVTGAISSNMLAGITKTGPGTLQFSAADTYTGPTIVNAGILSLNAGASVGTAPAHSHRRTGHQQRRHRPLRRRQRRQRQRRGDGQRRRHLEHEQPGRHLRRAGL